MFHILSNRLTNVNMKGAPEEGWSGYGLRFAKRDTDQSGLPHLKTASRLKAVRIPVIAICAAETAAL